MWLWHSRFLTKFTLLLQRLISLTRHGFYATAGFILPAVFFTLLLYPASADLQDAPVYLKPPGLRFAKDLSVVVPAIHPYPNQPPAKPVYRKAIGTPAKGWAAKYVGTRRFSSDQSAWIYYRIADLAASKTANIPRTLLSLRIWPVGTTIVLESYRGDAAEKNEAGLMEILAMQKTKATNGELSDSFYSANWNYARFTPQGELSFETQKVAECHQCHSIAFHLTGDLTFTQFP